MNGNEKKNSNNITFKWITGLLITIVLLILGNWINNLNNNFEIITAEAKNREKRLTILETQFEEIKNKLNQIIEIIK